LAHNYSTSRRKTREKYWLFVKYFSKLHFPDGNYLTEVFFDMSLVLFQFNKMKRRE